MEDKIMNTNLQAMQEKLEIRRKELDDEKRLLTYELEQASLSEFDFDGLYHTTQNLFINLEQIWDLADRELRQLLIMVQC
ncbi:MAG: hypothetical protein V4543_07745 [Bacteroidota bacterium]